MAMREYGRVAVGDVSGEPERVGPLRVRLLDYEFVPKPCSFITSSGVLASHGIAKFQGGD